MTESSSGSVNLDPYKTYRFRLKWDGRYVAGISRVGALRRSTEVVRHSEGGDPNSIRKSPGRTEYDAVTLERGVTHDPEFERWADLVARPGDSPIKDFRKDLILDRARENQAGNQVNVFLFQTSPNASWRNVATEPGGLRPPPLALNLLYLLSAHGRDDDDSEPFSHRLLGEAMRVLHEQPVLDLAEPGPAQAGGVDRVRITLQPLSLEEMTKLWTIFQTPYRLSAVYEATVILIDRPPEGTGHGG